MVFSERSNMNIREKTELLETQYFSKLATLSSESLGRDVPIPECEMRTCFARDRDRIIHTKSFRRLMRKTQVFIRPEGDHYRTRLTHTLEVSQIARAIGKALMINEDLIEAIALGHDLGHTPFGHAGERALRRVSGSTFRHSDQSVRVVEKLEKDFTGLNLTKEVRDGIKNHSLSASPFTNEGRVVQLSDKIAYMNHDMDDAIRAGIMTEDDFPARLREMLGHTPSDRIDTLVKAVVAGSAEIVAMPEEISKAFLEFRSFMFDRVYNHPAVKEEEQKAERMVEALYESYTQSPDKLPPEYLAIAETDGIDRAVCDYISGMSDRFATGLFEELFIPRSWGMFTIDS